MSGVICRTRKEVAPGKNDKICFKGGEILNGKKKNKTDNKMPPKKSGNEARKFLPSMLSDPNLKISYSKTNPKKAGSKAAERYDKYKRATTLKKARELGATREDLIFDGDRGFMKVIQEAKPPDKLVDLKKKNPSKAKRSSTPPRARTPPRRARTPQRPISEGRPPGLPITNEASMNINRLALSVSGAVQQDAVSTLSALNSIFAQPL